MHPLPAAVEATKRKRSPTDKEEEERWAIVKGGRTKSTVWIQTKDGPHFCSSLILPDCSLFPCGNIQTRFSLCGRGRERETRAGLTDKKHLKPKSLGTASFNPFRKNGYQNVHLLVDTNCERANQGRAAAQCSQTLRRPSEVQTELQLGGRKEPEAPVCQICPD